MAGSPPRPPRSGPDALNEVIDDLVADLKIAGKDIALPSSGSTHDEDDPAQPVLITALIPDAPSAPAAAAADKTEPKAEPRVPLLPESSGAPAPADENDAGGMRPPTEASQAGPEQTLIGDLLDGDGDLRTKSSIEYETPTMIVRADKVLARARELRALKLQLGTTQLIDRDAEAERARLAKIAEARRQRLYRIFAGVCIAAIVALLLVVAVDAFQSDSEPSDDQTAAVETEPLPSPEAAPSVPALENALPAADKPAGDQGARDEPSAIPAASEVSAPPESKTAQRSGRSSRAAKGKKQSTPHVQPVAKATRKPGGRSKASAPKPSKPDEAPPAPSAEQPSNTAVEASATASMPPPASPPAPTAGDRAPKLASIEVRGPAGVSVEIDGAEIGKTPLEPLTIAPGRYTLWASKKGFEVFTRDVEVAAGKSVTIEIKLVPIPSVGLDAAKK
jgi:hypothetical protein